MKLDQLQYDFIAAIFNADRETALKHIKSDDNLDASQRLSIYRGSVHGILTQSLGDTFPVTKALLGDEFFDKMCDRFIDQFPPNTPFFSDFGDNLATFLADFDPVKTIPFISDVADFEWSRNKLWQQLSAEPFDFSQLSVLDEEQQASIIFNLNRTLHLFESPFRIDLIWFAHQADSTIKLEEIDFNEDIKLLMWKSDNTIKINDIVNQVDDIEATETNNIDHLEYWRFLKAISNKSNIVELADTFGENFPTLLNKSIQDGCIQSFTTS